ncbi:hypothetical protein BGZ47_008398 [Haplosporangium gracile]|nr:hypothetical protein BGZ47_008398 [Haplosporangium gracile]
MSDPLDPVQVQPQSPDLVDPSRRHPREPPSQLQPRQPPQLPHHHQSLPYSSLPTATALYFPSTSESETMSSSTTTEGQPPVTYMANLIAQQLLQVGASMFNRRADANCVLKVGNERYFVHVQMLASRSPTFRRIFDEMIAQEAWGGSLDADVSSDEGASYGQLEEDDEPVSYNSDYGYQDSVNLSGEDHGPDSDDNESMRDDNSVSSSNQGQRHCRRFRRVQPGSEDPSALVNAFPHQLGPMDSTSMDQPSPPSSPQEDKVTDLSIERLSIRVRQKLRVQDESCHDHEVRTRRTVRLSPELVSAEGEVVEKRDEDRADGEGAETSSDDGEDGKSISSVGIDGGLPELVVTFADPEGSHFKELLYWLYTGNSKRWIQFFTFENYGSILQNILHLNIVTREVLEICMVFEASTSPELGLRGMALSVLCRPSSDYLPQFSPDMNTNANATAGPWAETGASPT